MNSNNSPTSTFIIPFTLPWDWSADYQKQTCLELAKEHKVVAYMQRDRIFFLKAILKRNIIKYTNIKNIYFYRPYYFLPFQRINAIEKINQILSFKIFEFFFFAKTRKILWIFDSIFYNFCRSFKGMKIYDCVDLVWNNNSTILKEIQKLEKYLIRDVNYFFVNSYILAKKHSKIRSATKILPQGFRIDDFSKPISINNIFPKDKPIIGFVGAFNHRINFDLVTNLIKRNSQWHFVFWGPTDEIDVLDSDKTFLEIEKLKTYKNVTIGKSKDRKEIPSIINKFSIGIIPYDIKQDVNYYCYPMKTFEYFYEGIPVVSTPIEELKRFPDFVKIGTTVNGWEKIISLLIEKTWPNSFKSKQKLLAIENSWKNKVSQILSTIQID